MVFVVVYVRKFVPAFRAGLSTPQQVSRDVWASLANFFDDDSFHVRGNGAGSKNNVRLIDGNELARLEKAMQASGDETSVDQ